MRFPIKTIALLFVLFFSLTNHAVFAQPPKVDGMKIGEVRFDEKKTGEIKPGGWTPYKELDETSKTLFQKAFERHVGTTYQPYCVSIQVVAGKNYRFFCGSTTTTNPPQKGNAIVELYVDLNGEIKDQKITDLPPKELVGGWTEFQPLNDKAKDVFKETLGKVRGVSYRPMCVSTQVVAGTNYRFLCSSSSTTNPPAEGNAFAVVYVDLQGNKKVTEIKKFDPRELPDLLKGSKGDKENGVGEPRKPVRRQGLIRSRTIGTTRDR